jgi:predicted nucleic acid-binding protein
MTRRKGLVLDANILLRAVFGQRVRELLEAFEDHVIFYSPMCVLSDSDRLCTVRLLELRPSCVRFS